MLFNLTVEKLNSLASEETSAPYHNYIQHKKIHLLCLVICPVEFTFKVPSLGLRGFKEHRKRGNRPECSLYTVSLECKLGLKHCFCFKLCPSSDC